MHTHLGRRRPGEQKTSGPCYEKHGPGTAAAAAAGGVGQGVPPGCARLPAVCRTGAETGRRTADAAITIGIFTNNSETVPADLTSRTRSYLTNQRS